MANLISTEIWKKTDDLIAQIYSLQYDLLLEYVVESLRDILSFSHSLYHYIRQKPDKMDYFALQSRDIPKEHIDSYIHEYSKYDFINWYSATLDARVFRESDIISKDLLDRSHFMRYWMQPIGLYYGAGMIIANGEHLYASIFLYRSEDEEDFSDQDLEILNTINRHLCLRFSREFPDGLEKLPNPNASAVLHLKSLTKRETEIIEEIQRGTLRKDLSDKLFITENTLNKHLDNIYKKLGINSYEKLMQIIMAASEN